MQPEWEIWIDANLSPAIAKWLSDHTGFIVKSAYSLNLRGLSDPVVFQMAKQSGKVIIISKDADFADLVNRLGSPPKLINIKIGNRSNRLLWEYIQPSVDEAISLLTTTEIEIVDIQ